MRRMGEAMMKPLIRLTLIFLSTIAVFAQENATPEQSAPAAVEAATPARPQTSPPPFEPGKYPYEIVASLDVPPGNITVTPDGRVLFSTMQFFETELRAGELKDGKVVPFPNEAWSLGGPKDFLSIDTALGIQSDPVGIVWILDNAQRGKTMPKLIGWDTRNNRLHKIIYICPPLINEDSFLNDLSVDATHGKIFISDTAAGRAALLVVDIRTGMTRRLLEGHKSMLAEDIDLVIDGYRCASIDENGNAVYPRVPVNGLALDAKNEWLYYGPFSGHSMYRVRVADLLDESLSSGALSKKVERYSEKPISDGMGTDYAGNIYLTSVSENAVGVITPNREFHLLFKDDNIVRWPDGMSYGPDGYMYIVANQLHLTPRMHTGEMVAKPPYYIIRFKALAPGVVGR
ncbi:MAG: hypothetical protein GC154_07565 [bacterium]|nr:hypothetical protein [bacterium]